MIRAVIFDLDDTLYEYGPLDKEAWGKVRELACGELGISVAVYEEAYSYGRRETKRQLENVAASHNRLLYETYWGIFLEKMRLFDGVREFMDRMHERGITMMVCTDLTAHIQHRKIEALRIAEDIKYLVTSEEAGREKPAPEMFALCLEKLKKRPEEVCCIGDSLERDVKAALAAGMQAVQFYPDRPSRPQYRALEERVLSGVEGTIA